MPRFDGTGPLGIGPRTGRGLGPCGVGLGFRRGSGRGFGFRWFDCPYGIYPTRITKKEELEMLDEEEKALEEDLKAIRKEKESFKAQK